MTLSSRGARLVLATALTTALAVVGAVPVSATGQHDAGQHDAERRDADRLAGAGAEPTMQVREVDDGSTTLRHVTVQWKGDPRKERYSKSVPIPGIGRVTITCRPDTVRISLEAEVRDNETQMWMAKYEDKSYGPAVAVKTTRIYRYAHANDDGTGGTGNPQHEGLNQRGGVNGVENYGKGYGHGIISQRAGRNQEVGADPLRPVTSFDVNWYWNGFDYPPQYRSCKIDATFLTKQARIGINWHGEADAAASNYQRVAIPGLGYLELRCEPERYGRQTVTFIPDALRTKAYVEVIEGEGRVDEQVETRNRTTDRETGKLGPMAIPTNGMMRMYVDTGDTTIPFILSSYQKLNDRNPRLNSCEVAMGQFPR